MTSVAATTYSHLNPEMPPPPESMHDPVASLHMTLNDMELNLQGMASQRQLGDDSNIPPIDGTAALESTRIPASEEMQTPEEQETPPEMPHPVPKVDPALLKKTNGYVNKCGGTNSKWKKRFLMLQIPQKAKAIFKLFYFVKDSDKQPKGVISLENAHVEEVDMTGKKKSKNSGDFRFNIQVTGGRVFELGTDQEQEMLDWVETIQACIDCMRQHAIEYQAAKVSHAKYHRIRGAADRAQNCEAFGPGLFRAAAGKIAEFTLQPKDVLGNPVIEGGEKFTANLQNDDLHYDLLVTDNLNGTYRVEYCTIRAGDYKLHVYLADHKIFGSPFDVKVTPGPVSAKCCVVQGEGVRAARVGGVQNYFSIVAKDDFDNDITAGGAEFEVGLAGGTPPPQLSGFRDNGNGKYSGAYVVRGGAARALGEMVTMQITLGLDKRKQPIHLPGSPFQLPIIDATADVPDAPPAASSVPTPAVAVTSSSSPTRGRSTSLAEHARAQVMAMGGLDGGLDNGTVGGAGSYLSSAEAVAVAGAGGARLDATMMKTALQQKQRDIEDQYERLQMLKSSRSPAARGGSTSAFSPSVTSPPGAAAFQSPDTSTSASMGTTTVSASGGRSNLGAAAQMAQEARQRARARGGGRGVASPGVGIAADVKISPEVLATLHQNDEVLRRVFSKYSALSASGAPEARLEHMLQLAQDYDVVPSFLAEQDIKGLYMTALAQSGAGVGKGMNYGAFMLLLTSMAFKALSKDSFAELYPTDQAKVKVLLELWGLADGEKAK